MSLRSKSGSGTGLIGRGSARAEARDVVIKGQRGVRPAAAPAQGRSSPCAFDGHAPRLGRSLALPGYRIPEARLTVNAKMTVLNRNESNPCTKARRRSPGELIWTSETWQVIPITNEK